MSYRYTKIYDRRNRRFVGEVREDLVGGLAWAVYTTMPGVHGGGFSFATAVAKLASLTGYRPEELED